MKMYRYKEVRYSNYILMLVKMEFEVIKETPKGYWIDNYGKKRFVLKDSTKRYACLTPEDAFISYQARKKRQIKILEAKLAEAKAALRLIVENGYERIECL